MLIGFERPGRTTSRLTQRRPGRAGRRESALSFGGAGVDDHRWN